MIDSWALVYPPLVFDGCQLLKLICGRFGRDGVVQWCECGIICSKFVSYSITGIVIFSSWLMHHCDCLVFLYGTKPSWDQNESNTPLQIQITIPYREIENKGRDNIVESIISHMLKQYVSTDYGGSSFPFPRFDSLPPTPIFLPFISFWTPSPIHVPTIKTTTINSLILKLESKRIYILL